MILIFLTTYTIKDEMLIVGIRYLNTKKIPISAIIRISSARNIAQSWRSKRNYAFTFAKEKKIEVYYMLDGKEDFVVLSPKKISEFIDELKKRNPKIISEV